MMSGSSKVIKISSTDPLPPSFLRKSYGYFKGGGEPMIYKEAKWFLRLTRWTLTTPLTKGSTEAFPWVFEKNSTIHIWSQIWLIILIIIGCLRCLITFNLAENTISRLDASSRALPDYFLLVALVGFSIKRSPIVVKVLQKFAAFDEALLSHNIRSEGNVKFELFVLFITVCYASAFTAFGFLIGNESCQFDYFGLIETVFQHCAFTFALNGIYSTIVACIYGSQYLLFLFMLSSFNDRLRALQERMIIRRELWKNELNIFPDLLDELIEILKTIIDANSPMVFIRYLASLITTIMLVYFSFVVISWCHYDIAFFILCYVSFDVISIYSLANYCQIIINRADRMKHYLKSSASGYLLLDSESQEKCRVMSGYLEQVETSLSATGFFGLSRHSFMMMVNTMATFLVIIFQFQIDSHEDSDGGGHCDYGTPAYANHTGSH